MRTTVLYGEYELTIDGKNRLLVPAEVRKSLDPERDGEAFFLVVGDNRKSWLFTERVYEALVASLATTIAPGDDLLAFDQVTFAMAHRIEWDKQGRILLPEKNLQRTKLDKDVTMIGSRDHLELWNRSEWDAHSEKLISRREDIGFRMKQANPAGNG